MKIIFEENDRKITIENSNLEITEHIRTLIEMLYAWGFGERTIIDGMHAVLEDYDQIKLIIKEEK